MANKKPISAMINPDSLERLKNAAISLGGETSISSLLEQGGIELIERLEAERGAPFPQREGEVKRHRPKKAEPKP